MTRTHVRRTVRRFARLRRPVGLGERGQTLVEFALVFPVFLSVLIAVIEFAFVSNALLALSFAARDASAIAAEACGDGTCGLFSDYPTADCHILERIERDIQAPADPARIIAVSVYWTDINGHIAGNGAAVTRYERGGETTCDSEGATVPYTLVEDGYPQAQRCSIMSGCPNVDGVDGDEHDGLDTIGVRIDYDYPWHTPYATLFGAFGGSQDGFEMSRGSEMRMEPTL
jgi:hypothetical protein